MYHFTGSDLRLRPSQPLTTTDLLEAKARNTESLVVNNYFDTLIKEITVNEKIRNHLVKTPDATQPSCTSKIEVHTPWVGISLFQGRLRDSARNRLDAMITLTG